MTTIHGEPRASARDVRASRDRSAPLRVAAQRSAKRNWLYRGGAVLIALAPFVAAELTCIAFDWGRPERREDPFVGFSDVHPLFVPSDDESRYEIAESRLSFFAPDSFAAKKPSDEFRIFCLGGSTVQGRPWSIETSFTTWLEIGLQEADPSRQWEVVNCGGVSYASYRLVPILEEVLSHEPDLIILCTGHNEFLEDRSYGHLRKMPDALCGPLEFLAGRRLVVIAGRAFQEDRTRSIAAERPVLADDADAILDYRDGLAAYHRDDQWQADVREHFAFNIRRMIALCRDAGVPLVLVLPPSNLCDQPPFKSEHRDDLTAEEQAEWERLSAAAEQVVRNDPAAAASLLEQCLVIDDRHAASWYRLGLCRLAQRRFEAARTAFVRARDEDVCPLRMITPAEALLRSSAEERGVPLLDAHRLLERNTATGILGDGWLIDHVHPSFTGHQEIATALVEEMHALNLVRPRNDWRTAAQAAFDEHLVALPDFYFLKGERTLSSVRGWTRGEADGPHAAQRYPHLVNPTAQGRATRRAAGVSP